MASRPSTTTYVKVSESQIVASIKDQRDQVCANAGWDFYLYNFAHSLSRRRAQKILDSRLNGAQIGIYVFLRG